MPKCKHCHMSFANGNGKGSLTRHCAAVKASRNRKPTVKASRNRKPTDWRAAGRKSKKKKNQYYKHIQKNVLLNHKYV